MLSKEDNELITRVGPGTPMGELMRHYWIPGMLSIELPAPDCAPVRVRLLGEDLIAFRDSTGRVGMLAHSCPHRGASLFFGRNEEDGLRCVYHGWKFDVTGACVDMPSEPPESNFKSKVRATAYPCQERGGVVWTYMGPRETPPPLPDLEANMLSEDVSYVGMVARDCNWLQGLEGDIDTSHLQFLHYGAVASAAAQPGTFGYYGLSDRSPRYSVVDMEYGTMYGAYRPAEEDSYYWRIASFLFPFYVMIPTGLLGDQILARAWVPIDDEHMMFVSMNATSGGRESGAGIRRQGMNYRPNSSDWLGRWRLTQNRDNDYLVDREKQRRKESFTGIEGILTQDQAVTESMGPIYDRSHEHLGTSDSMVIRTRRRMLETVRALRDHGTLPPGADEPELYRQRSGGVILPREANWVEATRELRKAFVEHPELDPSIVGGNA
jgi:phenylpropionate dioxygenase-like ring-hydroxylating dioxygenase large terminal subunit